MAQWRGGGDDGARGVVCATRDGGAHSAEHGDPDQAATMNDAAVAARGAVERLIKQAALGRVLTREVRRHRDGNRPGRRGCRCDGPRECLRQICAVLDAPGARGLVTR